MDIIPVIDLLGGQAVHAVKGEREKYRPVQSVLTSGSNALEVAGALISETGCSEIYIADLDQIQGKGSNTGVIIEIAQDLNVSLCIDAGTFDAESAIAVSKTGAVAVIIGSETLIDLTELDLILKGVPADDLIFSIDISGGRVLSRSADLQGIDPIEALTLASEQGINRFIILTLDRVGSGDGPDIDLMKRARKEFPGKTLIAGGGVKFPSHLKELKNAGADGVLVATSLHRGWIRRKDILEINK